MAALTLGVDIGTSSSKGVLVTAQGEVLATAVRTHAVAAPAPGRFEMDPAIWWCCRTPPPPRCMRIATAIISASTGLRLISPTGWRDPRREPRHKYCRKR